MVSAPSPSRRNSRSTDSSCFTPPLSAQAQVIAWALAAPPAGTDPNSRSGEVYSPDRLQENVADFMCPEPDEGDALFSRSSTLEPSHWGASDARQSTSLPSGHFRELAQSGPCCAIAVSAAGRASATATIERRA